MNTWSCFFFFYRYFLITNEHVCFFYAFLGPYSLNLLIHLRLLLLPFAENNVGNFLWYKKGWGFNLKGIYSKSHKPTWNFGRWFLGKSRELHWKAETKRKTNPVQDCMKGELLNGWNRKGNSSIQGPAEWWRWWWSLSSSICAGQRTTIHRIWRNPYFPVTFS